MLTTSFKPGVIIYERENCIFTPQIDGNCRNTQLFHAIAKIPPDHSLKDRHLGGCGTRSKSARREVIRDNKYIQWT
jgi:hypothetical protein